jgi:cytochrome P450
LQPGRYVPPTLPARDKPLGFFRLLGALKRNPLQCWCREHFELPIVRVELPIGRVLIVNNLEAIRRVLVDNRANYRKDPLQRRVLAAGLGEGLLSAEGERWRAQRRIIAPVFARKTIVDLAPAMLCGVERLTARWRRQSGAILDIAGEMSRLTLEVLERTIFSDGLGSAPEEFRIAMGIYFTAVGRIGLLDLLGMPPWVPRPAQLRIRSTMRFFESAIDDIIQRRRARASCSQTSGAADILSRLLAALDPDTGRGLTEPEVRSNILTFIAAGHETTANLLTWSLFLLSQVSQWREQVEAEAERELRGGPQAAGERLVLTRAVIDETARLYPPIAAISRMAVAEDELAGEPVTRGTLVVIAPYVLHRHRMHWRDAEIFDPHRFLGSARAAIDRYAYIPFGAGARTCIGSAFALQEATLALAAIVRNFDLELACDTPVLPTLQVTLRPSGGLPMIISYKNHSVGRGQAQVMRHSSATPPARYLQRRSIIR